MANIINLIQTHKGFNIGNTLKRIRKLYKITQKQLAENSNFDQSIISKIESNLIMPNEEYFRILIEKTKINKHEFIYEISRDMKLYLKEELEKVEHKLTNMENEIDRLKKEDLLNSGVKEGQVFTDETDPRDLKALNEQFFNKASFSSVN